MCIGCVTCHTFSARFLSQCAHLAVFTFFSKELCAAVRHENDTPPVSYRILCLWLGLSVCHCFEGVLQVVFELLSIVLKRLFRSFWCQRLEKSAQQLISSFSLVTLLESLVIHCLCIVAWGFLFSYSLHYTPSEPRRSCSTVSWPRGAPRAQGEPTQLMHQALVESALI